MLQMYVFIYGLVLVTASVFEFTAPMKTFRYWHYYVSSRGFFLHGVILITAGFPLVMYRGVFSPVVFVIGVIVVLTGPFILLYPEKVRAMYGSVTEEVDDRGMKRLVYFDASIRLTAGMIFTASYFF
jgi:hypothetical protein